MPRLKALLLVTLPLATACGLSDPLDPDDLELPVPRATVLAAVSGDDQVGGAGAELAAPLRVRVLDQFGNPVEDVDVTFAVATGGGSVAPVTSATDENGVASAEWTLGGQLGTQELEATTSPATTVAYFSATAVAGVPSIIVLGSDTLRFDALGDTARVTVTATDAFGNSIAAPQLTWSSDNADRASVNGAGLVTSTGNGTTRVIASSGTAADTVVVVVEQTPAQVVLEPATDTLIGAGSSVALRARVFDARGRVIAGAPITWSSTAESIATVGTSGVVSAVSDGTATVIATHGALADSTTIVVRVPVALEVAPAADTLFAPGDTLRLRATVTDAGGDSIGGTDVVWASLDTALARVDAYGRVTARAAGNARIVATLGALADTALIAVAPDTTTPAPPRAAALRAATRPDVRGTTNASEPQPARERPLTARDQRRRRDRRG